MSKEKCKYLNQCGWCGKFGAPCGELEKPRTNYNKIKSMTVEEMADLFLENEEEATIGELWATKSNVIRWLKSEVAE